MLKVKNCQSKILYSAKIFFRNESYIKKFSDEGKLKAFITRKHALTEFLKEIFPTEGKLAEGNLGHQE